MAARESGLQKDGETPDLRTVKGKQLARQQEQTLASDRRLAERLQLEDQDDGLSVMFQFY